MALVAAAIAHAAFAWHFSGRRPELAIIRPPPNAVARNVLALGDQQFLYRIWALDLQNAGDTGGRATPLRLYNYDHVVGWLETLRALDSYSQFHTFLAAHYFGVSQRTDHIRAMVEFIVRDAEAHSEFKWPWLMQATVMAQDRLRDLPYALVISQRLAAYDYREIPGWVLLFPATLLEKLNRPAEARAVIAGVYDRAPDRLSDDDRQWVANFLQRLAAHGR